MSYFRCLSSGIKSSAILASLSHLYAAPNRVSTRNQRKNCDSRKKNRADAMWSALTNLFG